MATMRMEPVGFFKVDPKNPRTSADEKDLDHLGDDMLARGVLVPLLARPDGTIVDGWRRWLAAQRKGIKQLPVIITDKPENEIRGIQLATVFHRADLTGHEKWMACAELMCMNPGWQMKDLAEFLHLGQPTITKILSVSKCSAAWHQALAAGTVGIGECYAASGLPEAEQAAILTQKLSGASRDDIVHAAKRKKSRSGNKPSVKAARVKLVLPTSGVCIVASGQGLTLDGLCDALGEAQKAARAALAQDHDIKSFPAAMAAKNKKRGTP
jgi:ParB family transcriptional regulator, chromosome partitioning protein